MTKTQVKTALTTILKQDPIRAVILKAVLIVTDPATIIRNLDLAMFRSVLLKICRLFFNEHNHNTLSELLMLSVWQLLYSHKVKYLEKSEYSQKKKKRKIVSLSLKMVNIWLKHLPCCLVFFFFSVNCLNCFHLACDFFFFFLRVCRLFSSILLFGKLFWPMHLGLIGLEAWWISGWLTA